FDVAAGTRLRRARPPAACAPAARFAAARGAGAAEEGLEEIGERVVAAEHLVHFFRRHRPVAALAAGCAADIPSELAGIESAAARRAARLLVRAPVRAELVVLLPFRGIAEHFVRLVEVFEACLGRFVPRVDVGMVLARELP